MLKENKPKIILASASPRRRELLEMLGVKFTVLKPSPGAEPPCSHSGCGLAELRENTQGDSLGTENSMYAEYSVFLGKEKKATEFPSEVRSILNRVGPYANLSLRLHEACEAEALAEVIQNVQNSAFAKAKSSASQVSLEPNEKALVIGADTVVVCGKAVLGKPSSKAEAKEMLSGLAGRWHHVVTGVAIQALPDGEFIKSCAVTAVKFRASLEQEIEVYTETGHPLDKAGAYGIQELGSLLVEKIDGCYFNVVGLPLTVLNALSADFGFNLFSLRD